MGLLICLHRKETSSPLNDHQLFWASIYMSTLLSLTSIHNSFLNQFLTKNIKNIKNRLKIKL